MKKLFFPVLVLLASYGLKAQSVGAKVVDVASVPQSVKEAQNAYFSGIDVERWELHGVKTKRKSEGVGKYVAVFEEGDQRARARYTPKGKGLSVSVYYKPSELPQTIQDAAASNYSGFTLRSGEKVRSLQSEKEFYRLRMGKSAQKLIVYLDSEGKEVTRNKAPEGIEVEEGIE